MDLSAAFELRPDLVAWRRHLHAHPELAYQEHATAAFVRERLEQLGLRPSPPLAGGTGLTCLIAGDTDGPTVALRADMDALPIQEATGADYASTVPGVAHLCGHDAHTTMLLGAAALLARRRPEHGHVKLLFQPAEEGGAGAARMIEDGALEDPTVSAVFGLHVDPNQPVGALSVTPGPATAASDGLDIEIIGEGGHAARPHQAIDAIAVAAQVIVAIQQLVSRHTDPLQPLVITLGRIEGGFARNVIAPSVHLQGTARSFDPALRDRLPALLDRTVAGVTQAFGARHELTYRTGYPSLRNDAALIPTLADVVGELLGEGRLATGGPSLGGEDFAFYAQRVPGLMARLGVRNEALGLVHPLHHPRFDLDEGALPLGAAVLAGFARRYLATH
ncbi:MAG: M20 family metallopeptidase [Trueperaceae bacterium]